MFSARIAGFGAALIALQTALLFGQAGNSPGVPGTIEGHVTNALTGEPIGGATVHLYPLGRRSGTSARAQRAASQQDGIFRFDSVPQGNYFLSAQASGFVTAGGRWRAERLVVDSGQQITGVVLQLNPQGTITGRVLDENRQPVPGATVQAYSTYAMRGRVQLRPAASAKANKAGEYTLEDLNPERYYISADPPQPAKKVEEHQPKTGSDQPASPDVPAGAVGFVRTFYPNALDLQSAASFEVAPGQPIAEADIRLRRAATYQLRGKVALTDGALGRATVLLSPRDTLDANVLGKRARVGDGGAFELKGVLPGSYTLWLVGAYPPVESSGSRQAGFRLLGRQDIDVTAGDVAGIVLSLTPPVNLTGHIVAEGIDAQRLSRLRVNFVPSGEVMLGNFQSVAVDEAGTFAVQNLAPGDYAVRVNNPPAGTYVKEVTYNRQDITISGLDLSMGGAGEIEVVLRPGVAEVDGAIQTDNSSTAGPGAIALLVPDNLEPDGYRTLTAPVSTGNFALKNVPPGHYYAYGLERWSSVWQNVEFLHEMQREGTSVDVGENGHPQVQLPLITEQEVELTAARLGLTVQ